MDWNEKTVFITGASSGIGSEMAIRLAKRGAIIGLLARRKEELEKVRKEIEAEGGKAEIFPADVTNHEAVKVAVELFRRNYKQIDILVVNAGISGGAVHAKDITPEKFSEVIEINLLGAVNTIAAALPEMIRQGSGRIVAISSLAGFRGLPKSASYSASKAAMTALFESIRLDLLQTEVAVTIIQPGFIKTPLTSGREAKMPFIMELDAATEKMIRAIEKKKRFYAFPWQLAGIVRLGKIMPAWLYDRIAGSRNYRE